MRRVLVGFFAAMLAVGLLASGAEADRKRKAGKRRAKAPPKSEQIQESMGDVRWGMTSDEVKRVFIDKVKEKYRPLVAKSKDAVEEDRLRREAKDRIEAIQDGYVEFDGRPTGWDASYLKDEFTHDNDEAMLLVRDGNSQNFYFFIDGKLWKWYKAFDASVFPAGKFDAFASAVQRRFGEAKQAQAELAQGEGSRDFLEWQDKQTRLRAVDQSKFYGFFCLVFEEKNTVAKLAKLRRNTSKDKRGKGHALVEAVTAERTVQPDDSPNIVDRITGRIRRSEQAEETAEARGAGRRSKAAKSTPEEASDSGGVLRDDDPLSGLDF